MIDLRSDTVTQPTESMRRAMAQAEVGDDVFGEDPTVNRLEELAAKLLGMESALFVASGTMGNLIALLVHCPRGSEVILGDQSHIFNSEQGGAASVGSIAYHTIPTTRFGELPLDAIGAAIRDPSDLHNAVPSLLCLENTNNRCGGVALSVDYCASVRGLLDDISKAHGSAMGHIPMHLDGARLANAAVALNVQVKDLTRSFDSVQFDLSKGLAAPVGGIVAGSDAFITKARRARKMLGGGMRQAGVIAAAGIVAINEMIPRLSDDHANARKLAAALAELPQFQIDLDTVQTNIVFATIDPSTFPANFSQHLARQGIRIGAPRGNRLRFVTHHPISARDIDNVIDAVRDASPAPD
jgi:threonine aldolase